MRKLLRFVCILMAMMCLTPAIAEETEPTLRGWDKKDGYVYLTLGTFPQTAEGERLPILWRVLSVEDGSQPGSGRALILSEYVLEARRIHGDYKEYANKPTNKKYPGFNGDFTQTEMSKYLCGEFASANFAEGELAIVAEDETLGMFFLLSSDDLKNKEYGFTSNESRKAWGTEYALNNGLFKYMANRGKHSPYWTRTQSTSNIKAARCTKSQGELGYMTVDREDEGMRPACWLRMEQIRIDSGSGTKEDPYVLCPVPGSDEPVMTEAVPLENPTAE